ncbi:EcsC family protein [Profundibacterium mesophilum]|uniref:EcsC protein family domain containing protein n=1 Tax=Profundibacterium mesophilum KAUST100406-0324 TaxID=1037889 RepID=A0A921TG18_9RHOB|nr:EcsC family protein [Profundibacterium mesophilum]KAF0677009.1 EcsC protein family domain containing protein [Profundibacterium mesophilum KAUST100406-0324]
MTQERSSSDRAGDAGAGQQDGQADAGGNGTGGDAGLRTGGHDGDEGRPGRADIPLDPETRRAVVALAKRFRAADGIGMQVLALVGGQAETLIERLPGAVRGQLDGATRRALQTAFDAASASRGRVADQSDWLNTAVTTAMGAAGGFGGLPTALAELPVTTTVLLRAIQGIAQDEGFDPAQPAVRMQCLQVFAAAGPLARDDGSDLAFLSARVTLTGAAVHGLIARIAPRLATVLGQKLAAQTVPVLGAVAGAATNYAFTNYYQEMARVYFGLRRLARDSGADLEALMREFRLHAVPPRRIG